MAVFTLGAVIFIMGNDNLVCWHEDGQSQDASSRGVTIPPLCPTPILVGKQCVPSLPAKIVVGHRGRTVTPLLDTSWAKHFFFFLPQCGKVKSEWVESIDLLQLMVVIDRWTNCDIDLWISGQAVNTWAWRAVGYLRNGRWMQKLCMSNIWWYGYVLRCFFGGLDLDSRSVNEPTNCNLSSAMVQSHSIKTCNI